MFVPIERLFQWRSRRLELVALKRRLRELRGGPERDDAIRIRALKVRLAAATGAVSSCATCATGKAYPRGAYDGGDCCSGRTEEVFDDGDRKSVV